MSDKEIELTDLRRELTELRLAVQLLESSKKDGKEPYYEDMIRRMKAEREKEDKPAVVGSQKGGFIVKKGDGKGDNVYVYNSEEIFETPEKLPDIEKVISLVTALCSPIAIRGIHTLFLQIYSGEWVRLNKSELASALAVSEPELEQAFTPLVANETIRWGKNADGVEYYQLERLELFIPMLVFA